MDKYEQIEKETVQAAIENLRATTGIKAGWKKGKIAELDGELDIQFGEKPMHFVLEIKQELRNHNLAKVLEQAAHWKDFMVVANRIMPGVKEELRQKHIAYLEGNGNIFIDKKPVFIWLDNNKTVPPFRENPNRAFTKTGLQVVFLFLAKPNYINETYRTIAEATGTALGNVNNVINGLIEQGFLVRRNKNELLINDKKALLDKWVTAYEEKLKPTLQIGTFRFIGNNDWRELVFNFDETVWGGEPAGDILTNYLRPEIYNLYTTEPLKNLITKIRLAPDNKGNVIVFRKFWKEATAFEGKTAHPILVYADLINTNNKRCRETAQIIYERYIEPEL